MDIVDVMLARALTPQGQIESYARQSQAAVTEANQAVAAIDSITDQTNANNEKSQETLAAAEQALANINNVEQRINEALTSIQISNTTQINDEIDKLKLTLASTATGSKLTLNMPSGAKTEVEGWPTQQLYASTGEKTDGAMTQKAITDALHALSVRIDNIPTAGGGGGGVSNLGPEAASHIVIVGTDGNIIAGEITEDIVIQALVKSGTYNATATLGTIIDYENKSCERSQSAINLQPGEDFDSYSMFGGRMRCNVRDDGTITAFCGDSNYTEDGSNGQVMIYQPKFYYLRAFIKESQTTHGIVIRRESLILSETKRAGFRLHPLFQSGNEELDYVLLPAYNGSVFDTSEGVYLKNNEDVVDASEDKLCSIAGAKPYNGTKTSITARVFKTLAENRGQGWTLTTAEFESALQMLETVEFGSMNMQNSLELGLTNIDRSNATDCGAITGSTSSLGNTTGAATSTVVDRDGKQSTYTAAGARAVSYRGMENPWGSIWRVIGNAEVHGDGRSLGGTPYINGTSLDFQLPSASSAWISAMGHQNPDYDWVYLPIECATTANSAVPVGDALWSTPNLNGVNLMAIGGSISANNAAGPFYYSADMAMNTPIRYFNGSLMYVPTKNSIYDANINKWRAHYKDGE